MRKRCLAGKSVFQRFVIWKCGQINVLHSIEFFIGVLIGSNETFASIYSGQNCLKLSSELVEVFVDLVENVYFIAIQFTTKATSILF